MDEENFTKDLIQAIEEDRHYKNNSNIYLLSDGKIAKENLEHRAQNEFVMGNYLFEKGISVPKMYSLVSPFPNEKYPVYYTIMQKIDGEIVRDVQGEEKKEAIKQFREQITKVLEMNISPYDSFFGKNAIFNFKERKLYLIDFESWRIGVSEKELNFFNGMINFGEEHSPWY